MRAGVGCRAISLGGNSDRSPCARAGPSASIPSKRSRLNTGLPKLRRGRQAIPEGLCPDKVSSCPPARNNYPNGRIPWPAPTVIMPISLRCPIQLKMPLSPFRGTDRASGNHSASGFGYAPRLPPSLTHSVKPTPDLSAPTSSASVPGNATDVPDVEAGGAIRCQR